MKKNKGKKAKIKNFDEYYNNGLIELARTGNVVSLTNVMPREAHTLLSESIASKCDALAKEIRRIVVELRNLIIKEEPLSLLKFCQHCFLASNFGIVSEHQLSSENINDARITEYVQSIIVSSENNYRGQKDGDPTARYLSIDKLVKELYLATYEFCVSWAFSNKDDAFWNEKIDILVESILFFTVRGNRYQCIEEKYHRALLSTHDETLTSIYGVTADEVTDGLIKLLFSVSQGQVEPINQLAKSMDSYEKGKDVREAVERAFQDIYGFQTNDVIKVTGWPESLVQDLAYEIGEVKDFINEDNEYSGWPLLNLPIHRKPFIKVGKGFYCFDYYSLSDGFYRAVQRAVTLHVDTDAWNNDQQLASEKCVEDIFKKILPGCEVFRNNYYPINNSLKNKAENDLLILYESIVLIIEVKAGSFVYTSPFTDFESHLKSYKDLIEKADHQCERVCEYFERKSLDYIVFYNEDKTEKVRFKCSDVSKIFKISVTVDNINSFAARAEKLHFLDLRSNAICLGLDDLITYSEYFDSPLIFLHYLKQRELATVTPGLELYDELDHLGLYIEYNCYPLIIQHKEEYDRVFFDGYREELDEYFGKKYHPSQRPIKPEQEIPPLLKEIIQCIERNKIGNKVWLSSYLLDFNDDARNTLCSFIKQVIEKQNANHRMIPILCAGGKDSLRYCLYVSQPGINELSEREKEEHLLSVLLHNGEDNRVRIDLTVNEHGEPCKISGKEYYKEDIDNNMIAGLINKGNRDAELRVLLHRQRNGKIGRNELCPCGSGKKYKKCCGK